MGSLGYVRPPKNILPTPITMHLSAGTYWEYFHIFSDSLSPVHNSRSNHSHQGGLRWWNVGDRIFHNFELPSGQIAAVVR